MIPRGIAERFGIRYPIVSAPMGMVAGGRLAAAVSEAGGLGLIGPGYRDVEWIEREFRAAGGARVGVGFITWDLARSPERLEEAIGSEAPRYARAAEAGDVDTAAVWAGEGIDLIREVAPARAIVERLVAETEAALARLAGGDPPG